MQVKGKESCKVWVKLGLAGFLLAAVILPNRNVAAAVQGRCDTCHTMHNSQDGNTAVHVGLGAGWTGAGANLTGGNNINPQDQLLATDCVGCHANTGTETIITDPNGNKVPIVYNLGGYPAGTGGTPNTPLAGGNFYGVFSNDSNGHNVRGVVDAAGLENPDNILTLAAPGAPLGACGSSCHTNLTLTDAATTYTTPDYKFNGCKGCHLKVGHHNSADASYRYLGGHDPVLGIDIVDGGGVPNTFEHADWEQSATAASHNIYKRQSTPDGSGDRALAPIGMFCAGCHLQFHAPGVPNLLWGINNGGDDNTDNLTSAGSGTSWLRHPTNVNIPADGEYTGVLGQPYNVLIPVAKDPAGVLSTVNATDQVMCLSCHRAHASQYPDALRFNYNLMQAHSAAVPDLDTGCFYCHRTKDI